MRKVIGNSTPLIILCRQIRYFGTSYLEDLERDLESCLLSMVVWV